VGLRFSRNVTASVSSIRVVPNAGQAVTGVGKYRYIAMLAEGGMADVYLAVTQSAGFEKLVVIKQLRDSLAEDPTFVAMFMDEARLAARLNHPNVVQTLEVGTDLNTGLHFIAMEFLEGVAHVRLTRLKERVPPPLAFHLRILVDVLRGLHYAHELRDFDGTPLNVVHRDVSPQNVMLTFAGGVKVLDFGIAKAALAAEQRPEDFKGKLEYMAPEQAQSVPDVDRRADVFSVGVMLWEALARRRLYQKGERKLQMLVENQLPNLLDVAPSTPKRLARICAKAMAHDRDDRYASADAMADDLEEWLDSTTQHVSARDVGSYVAEKFASTQARINEAIEAQLSLFRSLPESAPETIPLSHLPIPDQPADLSDPPPPVAPAVLPSAATSSNAWATSDGTPPARIPPPAAAARDARRALVIAGIAIAGVVLLSAVVAIASKKPSAKEAAAAASASAAASESASASASRDPQIEFTIKASPPEARIVIDGTPFPSNPATGKHVRDGAIHLVRVEAPGYSTREEALTFDRSVLVSIALHPAESPAPSPSAPPPPNVVSTTRAGQARPPARPAAPSRPGQARPTPGGKLDSENPYQ
jgi:serine/threonine protein kinase